MDTELRVGCQVVAYADEQATIEQAVAADRAGFDAVTLPDHLFHPADTEAYLTDPPWEAFTVLGAIATRTEQATLFPAVADSIRRHPTLLAHATATLDRLSDGRGALGLGAGEAFNLAGVPDFATAKPFTRFRECLDAVQGLWGASADEPYHRDGEYYEFDGAHLGLEPVTEPAPPVYVGGYGPKMRALTGRRAAGWLPWIYDPASYERDLAVVLEAARDAGRDPAELSRSVMLPTTVFPEGEGRAARETARERSRVNLALRPAILDALGHPDLAERAPVMRDMAYDATQREHLEAVAAAIPDAAVDEIVIAGDPDDAIAQLERFVAAGVDFPILVPTGDVETTVEQYRENVLPSLR